MKITAAVLDHSSAERPYGLGQPLRLAEIDLAAPRPGELLVEILAAGICHSDLSVVNGDRPRPTPMVLGHEAAAKVIGLGSQDSAFAVGDHVVLAFLPACGECAECGAGRGYLCALAAAANGQGKLLRGGFRLRENDHDCHHHLGVSAFASHAVIDERSAVKIDRDIPPQIAALFGCAVLTGVGAVVNTAAVRPGESVIIHGLGGVGLSALLGAVASGAQPIVAIDLVADKRALALELGATHAVHPSEAEAVIRAMAGSGADVVVETVGKATVLATAYAQARRGGRVITVGLPNPAEMLSIPAVSLVADAKTLMGSYMGSSVPGRDIPRYIALWRAGRLPVDRLLTSVNPLSEINDLLEVLAKGDAVRQIVEPAARG